MSKDKVLEPPARLVEAARQVIASTAALAQSASATTTESERQAQKSEKERQRLREKKKRAKEKKKLDKKTEEAAKPAPAVAPAVAVAEQPKSVATEKPVEPAPASKKKKNVDEATDVLGIPLRPQVAKLLGVGEDELAALLERGSYLAIVRNATHVLAFGRLETTDSFAVIANVVGAAPHVKRVVQLLITDAKSKQEGTKTGKKHILVAQATAADVGLATSGVYVQLAK